MEIILGIIILYGIGKALAGSGGRSGTNGRSGSSRSEREQQTIFKYPKGGYGLDDDPVWDELFFLDIMEDDH